MVWKLTVLALIGLVLAAGLCVFDDDGAGTDLCNATAVIVTAALTGVSLAGAGRLELRRSSGYLAALPDLPVPPPRA
jgi:hypothetical protein